MRDRELAVSPIVAEPVQQPMPTTICPKLRRMRELLVEEAAAKAQNDRAQRREAAIQKWRAAPAEAGHSAFFQLAVDLRGTGLSMAEIENIIRLEAGNARHPAERRREIKSIMRTLEGSWRRLAALLRPPRSPISSEAPGGFCW